VLAACAQEPPPPPPPSRPASISTKKASSLPEGQTVVGFDLASNDETRFDARPLLGKKNVILHFFATWVEAKDLLTLQEAIKGKDDFVLLAISIDDPEARASVDEYVKTNKLTMPVLLDPKGELLEVQYNGGISEAPKTIIINKNSKIVAKRSSEEDEETPLKDLLSKLSN
jgi:peroxiredoxin